MDANELIHAQLVKAGVTLAASLPDDWVNGLIRRVTAGNQIKHIPVGREAETIAICAGAFFGGVRSVAIMGNTGLLHLHRRDGDAVPAPHDPGVLHRQRARLDRRPQGLSGGAGAAHRAAAAGLRFPVSR